MPDVIRIVLFAAVLITGVACSPFHVPPAPTAVPTVTKSCALADGTPIIKAFQPYTLRWADAVALAKNTAGANLASPIGELQAVRRDVVTSTWPPCGKRAADTLTAGMDDQIDGFVKYMAASLPSARFDVEGTRVTYSQLVGTIGQERADAIVFGDALRAIDQGNTLFDQFSAELVSIDGQPAPLAQPVTTH